MFTPKARILAQFNNVANAELRQIHIEQINSNFRNPKLAGLPPEKRNIVGNKILQEMTEKKMLFESGHLMNRMQELALPNRGVKITPQKEREIRTLVKLKTGKQLSAGELYGLKMKGNMRR